MVSTLISSNLSLCSICSNIAGVTTDCISFHVGHFNTAAFIFTLHIKLYFVCSQKDESRLSNVIHTDMSTSFCTVYLTS